MSDEQIRLGADFSGVSQEARKSGEALEEMEAKTKKAAAATANLGQTALQGGRFLQDFAQGGIGGVLNNIEGLVGALGYGPGLAGIMTAVGLAAYFALPKIKDWVSALVDGSNEVPKTKDAVSRLNDEIKENSKALDTLKERQSLTNKELAEFNERTEKAVKLQGELAEATRKRKEAEQVAALKPHGVKEAEAERAEGMQAFLGGEKGLQQEAIEAATRRFLAEQADNDKRMRAAFALNLSGKGTDASRKEADERMRRANELERLAGGPPPAGVSMEQHVRGRMTEMLNRAIATGDEAAMRGFMRFLPGEGFGAGGQVRSGMESLMPEAMAQQEAEIQAGEEHAQQLHRAGQSRRAQAKAAAERRKAIQKQIAESTRQKFADSTEESRRRAARQKEAAAEDRPGFDARLKAAHSELEGAMRQAKDTDIDEQAVILASQMRAAGGFQDRFGRFHAANPQQQNMQLQRMIHEELQKRFPGMSPMVRTGVAGHIGMAAGKQIDQVLEEARAQAMQAGINTQQMTINALHNLAQRYQQLARQNRDQQRAINTIDNITRMHRPSAASNGWP